VTQRITDLRTERATLVDRRAAAVTQMGQIEVSLGELDSLIASLTEVHAELVVERSRIQGLSLDVSYPWRGDHHAESVSACGAAEQECTSRVNSLDAAITRLHLKRGGLSVEWDTLSGQRTQHNTRIGLIDAEVTRLNNRR